MESSFLEICELGNKNAQQNKENLEVEC